VPVVESAGVLNQPVQRVPLVVHSIPVKQHYPVVAAGPVSAYIPHIHQAIVPVVPVLHSEYGVLHSAQIPGLTNMGDGKK